MMLKKKHVLILVPDGVGIKNYLYSKILSYLKNDTKISIWSPLPKDAFAEVSDIHQLEFEYRHIHLRPESALTRLIREAVTYARLVHNSRCKENITILTNWRMPGHSLKVRVLYTLARWLGQLISTNYNNILKLERFGVRMISNRIINDNVQLLEEIAPDSIFITHQRVAGLMPICLAASRLDIKSTTAIFSWDNLPKARLAVQTDQYLVWSDWMQNELKTYYPEISDTSISVVGTPQFEFYLEADRILAREEFAQNHNLDANKTWLCFSGDDLRTSPYDPLFLRDIGQALVPYAGELQLIFRRCPVDFSDRYDAVLEAYKDLIVPIDPIWNIESKTGWVGYFPNYNDIGLQVNLAYHCDLVLNLGSTMALDFATRGKPCLYLNYNPSNDLKWSTEVIYKYEHFRSMDDLKAVGWIDAKEEIVVKIKDALDNPSETGPDKQLWMERLVLHPINQNSKLIAKAIV